MKTTPDEIKKGLERCSSEAMFCAPEDPRCSYDCGDEVCIFNLMRDALAYIQQLEAERDAAVSELVGACQVCRWEETAKCASCHFCEYAWNVYENNWEWRGVQKEGTP